MDFWKPSLIYGRNKQNGNCYLEISTIPQSFMWGQSVTVFYMLQFWRNLEMNALSRIHTKTIKFWLNIISIYFYILWNLVQFGLTGKSIWSLWLPFVSYQIWSRWKELTKCNHNSFQVRVELLLEGYYTNHWKFTYWWEKHIATNPWSDYHIREYIGLSTHHSVD